MQGQGNEEVREEKCTYYHKRVASRESWMKNTIDMMVQLLDENNIPLPKGVRKTYGGLGSYNKERLHALVDGFLDSSSLIIDS